MVNDKLWLIGGSRKRAVTRSSSSAAWITARCGAASAERERERDAKKMMEVQLVYMKFAQANSDRCLTIPGKSISIACFRMLKPNLEHDL